ncbi:MAG TPA: DUF983 domain-containing protein [Stellaceae bacterium]|nr:DUF983 domain-containing protein [Stellaceae bacterium]
MTLSGEATSPARSDRWTAIKRALAGRCPICGQGKLFRAYLKLSDHCSGCGAPLAEYRADDGPAWATILVVGHLVVPFFILTVRSNAPDWVYYALLFPLTIALTLGLLPRIKGVFVALLWSFEIKNGVPGGASKAAPR